MPRKRNPAAARIEADYKNKKAKIKSGLRSARSGQSSEIRGESREGLTFVKGDQKPDPGAKRRASGEKAKSRIKKKPGMSKKEALQSSDPRIRATAGANAKAAKKKTDKKKKVDGSYDARRERATAKPKLVTASAKAKPATRKMIIGETSTLEKPSNWMSEADMKLAYPTKKKKKRKAPTYRG